MSLCAFCRLVASICGSERRTGSAFARIASACATAGSRRAASAGCHTDGISRSPPAFILSPCAATLALILCQIAAASFPGSCRTSLASGRPHLPRSALSSAELAPVPYHAPGAFIEGPHSSNLAATAPSCILVPIPLSLLSPNSTSSSNPQSCHLYA